jgi:predicted DCC family thiol-disulfide oxidoreductase YuxK
MTIPVVRFTVRGQDIAPGLGRPYTCVYDGTCKVCTRLANALRKWDRDGRIEIVPSQAAGVTARFPWIPARAYAAAIEELLNILPKGRLASWVFKIPFVRPLADRIYKWFARHRYRLGCGEHCQSRPLDVEFRDS